MQKDNTLCLSERVINMLVLYLWKPFFNLNFIAASKTG